MLTTQCPAHHGWVRPGWVRDDQVVIDAASYGSGCGRGRRHDKGLKVNPKLADVRGRGADGVGAARGCCGRALDNDSSSNKYWQKEGLYLVKVGVVGARRLPAGL